MDSYVSVALFETVGRLVDGSSGVVVGRSGWVMVNLVMIVNLNRVIYVVMINFGRIYVVMVNMVVISLKNILALNPLDDLGRRDGQNDRKKESYLLKNSSIIFGKCIR